MSYLLFGTLLIIPSLYYRKKLKECEIKIDKLNKSRWQWEDWGE